MGTTEIILKHENGKAGYSVKGEKTDIKDLLFSLMKEDRIFASLCAIAVNDFCAEENVCFSALMTEQLKKV